MSKRHYEPICKIQTSVVESGPDHIVECFDGVVVAWVWRGAGLARAADPMERAAQSLRDVAAKLGAGLRGLIFNLEGRGAVDEARNTRSSFIVGTDAARAQRIARLVSVHAPRHGRVVTDMRGARVWVGLDWPTHTRD